MQDTTIKKSRSRFALFFSDAFAEKSAVEISDFSEKREGGACLASAGVNLSQVPFFGIINTAHVNTSTDEFQNMIDEAKKPAGKGWGKGDAFPSPSAMYRTMSQAAVFLPISSWLCILEKVGLNFVNSQV